MSKVVACLVIALVVTAALILSGLLDEDPRGALGDPAAGDEVESAPGARRAGPEIGGAGGPGDVRPADEAAKRERGEVFTARLVDAEGRLLVTRSVRARVDDETQFTATTDDDGRIRRRRRGPCRRLRARTVDAPGDDLFGAAERADAGSDGEAADHRDHRLHARREGGVHSRARGVR